MAKGQPHGAVWDVGATMPRSASQARASREGDWSDAPTDPGMPAIRPDRDARRSASGGAEWPMASSQPTHTSALGRSIAHARHRQLGLAGGAVATVLVLLAAVAGVVSTGGLPLFGQAQPPRGVQANPVPSATPLPTATPTTAPTPTPPPTATPLPTATPVPVETPTPAATPNSTATPAPSDTPVSAPTATPAPTAIPVPTKAPAPTTSAPSATPVAAHP